MCITHLNTHACGHTSYITTDTCPAHLKAVEMVAYIETKGETPPTGTKVDINILLVLLAEWRRRCADESEQRSRRRNYKCGECLTELLKRAGLGEGEDGGEGDLVARMGRAEL